MSDDERDFYLERFGGFLLFLDLDKNQEDLEGAEKVLGDSSRYIKLPKLTFYELKKFMEGFVNEKVYDVDTKEKLLSIIYSRDAKENFFEFIYDQVVEMDKWQQYYGERVRIRIIEWLRDHNVQFVFEEDLQLPFKLIERLKETHLEEKVSKEIQQGREKLYAKAQTYYSSEALNPRPKRGRPPKQAAKVEVEPLLTPDFYINVPKAIRPFLFAPDYASALGVFSSKYDSHTALRGGGKEKVDSKLEALSQRLESLRHLSSRLHQEHPSGLEKGVAKGEQVLIEAVRKQGAQAEVKGGDEAKISHLAEGILPRKRGRPRKDASSGGKTSSVKVTPIRAKIQKKS